MEASDHVEASAVVEARVALAFVNVGFASRARISICAGTLKGAFCIDALSIVLARIFT